MGWFSNLTQSLGGGIGNIVGGILNGVGGGVADSGLLQSIGSSGILDSGAAQTLAGGLTGGLGGGMGGLLGSTKGGTTEGGPNGTAPPSSGSNGVIDNAPLGPFWSVGDGVPWYKNWKIWTAIGTGTGVVITALILIFKKKR